MSWSRGHGVVCGIVFIWGEGGDSVGRHTSEAIGIIAKMSEMCLPPLNNKSSVRKFVCTCI